MHLQHKDKNYCHKPVTAASKKRLLEEEPTADGQHLLCTFQGWRSWPVVHDCSGDGVLRLLHGKAQASGEGLNVRGASHVFNCAP